VRCTASNRCFQVQVHRYNKAQAAVERQAAVLRRKTEEAANARQQLRMLQVAARAKKRAPAPAAAAAAGAAAVANPTGVGPGGLCLPRHRTDV
jgi:hypothetical protein